MQFRAGSSYLQTGGTIYPAAQLILHPQYDPYLIDFDVAVGRVSDKVYAKVHLKKKQFNWIQTRLMRDEIWFAINKCYEEISEYKTNYFAKHH